MDTQEQFDEFVAKLKPIIGDDFEMVKGDKTIFLFNHFFQVRLTRYFAGEIEMEACLFWRASKLDEHYPEDRLERVWRFRAKSYDSLLSGIKKCIRQRLSQFKEIFNNGIKEIMDIIPCDVDNYNNIAIRLTNDLFTLDIPFEPTEPLLFVPIEILSNEELKVLLELGAFPEHFVFKCTNQNIKDIVKAFVNLKQQPNESKH